MLFRRLSAASIIALIVASTSAHTAFASPIFRIEKLSPSRRQALTQAGIYKAGCPVQLDRLNLLHISYYDFKGTPHDDGELIVMDALGPRTLEIFQALYQERFPFSEIRSIEAYGGDDLKSMQANNTSAFNCRPITGGSGFSFHSYGVAIDVNPLQNPYLNAKRNPPQVLPPGSAVFLDRTLHEPGMVESVASVFLQNGFSNWGGSWKNPKDWQHFQTSDAVALILAEMNANHAGRFFESYADYPLMLNRASSKIHAPEFIRLYRKDPVRFISLIEQEAKSLETLAPQDAIQYLDQRL